MPVEQVHANPTLGDKHQTRELSGTRYADLIQERTAGWRMWEYMEYDKKGNLLVNGVRVDELAAALKFPGAYEIVDNTNVQMRAEQWQEMTANIAEQVGYQGEIEHFYATKANPGVDVVTSAISAGVNIEGSSEVDMTALEYLLENGHDMPKRVLANGLKVSPEIYHNKTPKLKVPGLVVDKKDHADASIHSRSYAEMVVRLREKGVDITPVFDNSSELNYFGGENIPPMEVGVRLKVYGMAKHNGDISTLHSRHGMMPDEIFDLANKIDDVDHLDLTTFHAMIGAGETIPVDHLIDSLLMSADVYFQLKQQHSSLKYFNMGGGMAPLGFGYDHEEFLYKLFDGLQKMADKYGVEPPVMQFELGSFYAAESHHHAFKILKEKENGVDEDGNPHAWAITALSFMRAIPDYLVIGRDDFLVLAANNGNDGCKLIELGGLTCDSDDIWPSKAMQPHKLIVPDSDGNEQWFIIVATGAYGETITGVGGAGHSGQRDTAECVFYEGEDGKIHLDINPRQTSEVALERLGFSDKDSDRIIKKHK